MKRISSKFAYLLIAAAMSLSPGIVLDHANAAPPRVKGVSCSYYNAPRGTWVGYFDGLKESPIISFGDRYYPVTILRCFKTQADCKAWKYWVQTDYPTAIRTVWCRKK
jgi:hypothetical protein